MSARYEDFLKEVTPYVPHVPEMLAVNAIRNAAIEFTDKSMIWQYEVDPINTVYNQTEYTMPVPPGTGVARIMNAWYNTMPLTPKGENDLAKMFLADWRSIQGNPFYITQRWPDVAIIVPAPIVALEQGLNIIVALRPTRDSVSVDDFLYYRWAEAIADGAKARLLAVPQQPFTDQKMAEYYRLQCASKIGLARAEANRGLTRATLTVRPPDVV